VYAIAFLLTGCYAPVFCLFDVDNGVRTNIFKRNQNKINAIQDPNKMKPPKRLRNPPRKEFQQKFSTSKRQKTGAFLVLDWSISKNLLL
jgi:hypothetical protein